MTVIKKIEKITRDVWFGRELLWKVFWIYKILIGGFFGLLFQTLYVSGFDRAALPLLSFYFIYHVWVLKGLFECRFNVTNTKFIPNLVIGFVILNVFSLGFLLFSLFKKYFIF